MQCVGGWGTATTQSSMHADALYGRRAYSITYDEADAAVRSCWMGRLSSTLGRSLDDGGCEKNVVGECRFGRLAECLAVPLRTSPSLFSG